MIIFTNHISEGTLGIANSTLGRSTSTAVHQSPPSSYGFTEYTNIKLKLVENNTSLLHLPQPAPTPIHDPVAHLLIAFPLQLAHPVLPFVQLPQGVPIGADGIEDACLHVEYVT